MADNTKLLELVAELRELHHVFLNVEGARYFSTPFGFMAQTHLEHDSSHVPKGLSLTDGADSAHGVASHELAAQICQHLKLGYPHVSGRGAQLRLCCDVIEQHLKGKTP
jgi:hypothetical protein